MSLGPHAALVKEEQGFDRRWKNTYQSIGINMKFKNRLKRLTDILEKLGVASLAIGLFQDSRVGLGMGIGFLIAALFMTREEA